MTLREPRNWASCDADWLTLFWIHNTPPSDGLFAAALHTCQLSSHRVVKECARLGIVITPCALVNLTTKQLRPQASPAMSSIQPSGTSNPMTQISYFRCVSVCKLFTAGQYAPIIASTRMKNMIFLIKRSSCWINNFSSFEPRHLWQNEEYKDYHRKSSSISRKSSSSIIASSSYISWPYWS